VGIKPSGSISPDPSTGTLSATRAYDDSVNAPSAKERGSDLPPPPSPGPPQGLMAAIGAMGQRGRGTRSDEAVLARNSVTRDAHLDSNVEIYRELLELPSADRLSLELFAAVISS
jgi:hypothetical protein